MAEKAFDFENTVDGNIEVNDLKELRFNALPPPKHIKKYAKYNIEVREDLSITLVYGKHVMDTNCINLIAPSTEVCNQWFRVYLCSCRLLRRNQHMIQHRCG